jgi:ATP-dependent helicase/nuclease subunit A
MTVADSAARERLRTDFTTTFFVRAGAGTGKTTEVVARIVELVAAGVLPVSELVAITFTEAAAAELRARVREGLAQGGTDPARTPESRERCAVAARNIGEASIDTVHAFAGALLRTYPLDAGLPPAFEMLDPIQQDAALDEHFRSYFDAVGEGDERELVRRALLLGLTPDQLRDLMRAMHEHYDLMVEREPWDHAPPAPDAVALAHELAAHLGAATQLIRPEMMLEKIAQAVVGLGFATERLRQAQDEEHALAALRLVERIDARSDGNRGVWQANWGAGETLRELKERLATIEDLASRALRFHRTAVLVPLLGSMRRTILDAARARKRDGVATFHDLLTWARDLLRDDRNVRARAQARWSRIFIDEFQDTDPLQAEIAFYLASEPGSEGDWRDLPLVPGKLCVVGDPKQSIYRFRRADIALYQAIEERIASTVELSQNFRSVPRVLDLVNVHYGAHMLEEHAIQPSYGPLAAEPAETGKGVWIFGEAVDAKMPEIWAAEAIGVARAARRVVDDEWSVSEGKGTAREPRNARFGDIAVLIPSRTNLRRLERAFEDVNVPYRIESGELIVQTQEVRDLVSSLRAIDDPSDQVALLAALRSVAYGCSDVELLEWHESGGNWSYERPNENAVGDRVRVAFGELRDLHRRRHRVSVSALIQEVIDRRMLVAGAFGDPRPRESWRRYRYVLDRARAFGTSTSPTLRAFVDWIEGLQKELYRDVSTALTEEDEDAVRVLTVHGSKGLEFPVVILTGWGSSVPPRVANVLADRVRDRIEVGLGRKDSDERPWQTVGYADAEQREKQLGNAESIRLSYVAMTRTRDHLIVSLFRRAKETKAQAVTFAQTIADWGHAESVDIGTPPTAPPFVMNQTELEDVGYHESAEEAWLERREMSVKQFSGLRLMTATGVKAAVDETSSASGEEREKTTPPRFPRGRGGTALGRAVHATLQTVDLATLDGLTAIAQAQASAEGIPERAGEVERLTRAAAASDAVKRAVASGRYWREVPIGATVDGVVLEGFIDLLYEDGGEPVVVDYKTDRISAGEVERRMESYRAQGGAYAVMVREALAKPTKRVEFVFAALGQTRQLVDVADAELDVRRALKA